MRGLKFFSVIGLMLVLVLVAACGSNGSNDSNNKSASKDGVEIKHEEGKQKSLNTLNVLLFLNIHSLMH